VKFARLTPSEPECSTALADAEMIVARTVPAPQPIAVAPAAAATAPEEEEEEQDG
jgi:hypothetical protein